MKYIAKIKIILRSVLTVFQNHFTASGPLVDFIPSEIFVFFPFYFYVSDSNISPTHFSPRSRHSRSCILVIVFHQNTGFSLILSILEQQAILFWPSVIPHNLCPVTVLVIPKFFNFWISRPVFSSEEIFFSSFCPEFKNRSRGVKLTKISLAL